MDLKELGLKIEEIMDKEPIKWVISAPRKSDIEYKRFDILRYEIKGNTRYELIRYQGKKTEKKNIEVEEVIPQILSLVAFYKEINVISLKEEWQIKISKNNSATVFHKLRKQDEVVKITPVTHNRKKRYILEEGMEIPVFRELGIFTSDFKIVNSKYDKFKQINRFVELIDDEIKDYGKDSINIIDFGCGKSYLTFVLYYYLTQIRHIKANIIGLDLKSDVIMMCNELSKKYGYDSLNFRIGDINGFKAPFDVDMVVTLHACDTATDYALYNAISWGAQFIFSVPCCQHEINKQIKSEDLSGLIKYGIIKERVAALITDSVRGCMLEYCGYKTDVMEFVDMEHSPKNILIRARKTNVNSQKREKSLEEAQKMCREFSVEQKLMSLILNDSV